MLQAAGAESYAKPNPVLLYEDPNNIYEFASRVQAEVDSLNRIHQQLREAYEEAGESVTRWDGENMKELSLAALREAASECIIQTSDVESWASVWLLMGRLCEIELQYQDGRPSLKALIPVMRALTLELDQNFVEGSVHGNEQGKALMSLGIAALERAGDLVQRATEPLSRPGSTKG